MLACIEAQHGKTPGHVHQRSQTDVVERAYLPGKLQSMLKTLVVPREERPMFDSNPLTMKTFNAAHSDIPLRPRRRRSILRITLPILIYRQEITPLIDTQALSPTSPPHLRLRVPTQRQTSFSKDEGAPLTAHRPPPPPHSADVLASVANVNVSLPARHWLEIPCRADT